MDRLKKLFDADSMIISAWAGIQDSLYLQALAKTKFDAVTLDMQHGMQTEDSVIRGVAALEPSGKPTIVRIPVGRFDFVSKALDAGVHGIIAPMINTVEDAKRLVSFAKYIPVGDRSFGASQAAGIYDMPPVEYVKAGNENTFILAMIETQQAVDNMEAIADVEGIDGIFCGPGDLSISVRQNVVPDPYGPDTIKIIEKMSVEAKKRNKIAATWCGSPDHVSLANDMGFDYAALGHDSLYLNNGVSTMLDSLSFR